uniref:Uncharacterized protein LOC111114624 n=1 Tax=Crassostrea virginica TaxID=6565 RepID=A0A8B8BZA2_CRAVI|nr:uncharacterized protein LOC111114624 [Crassostrea virginica]
MASSSSHPLCQHCRFCNPVAKRRRNSRIRNRISRASQAVPSTVHTWINQLSSSALQRFHIKILSLVEISPMILEKKFFKGHQFSPIGPTVLQTSSFPKGFLILAKQRCLK